MAKGIYQKAFEGIVSEQEWKDGAPGIDALLAMCCECDRLRRDIIEAARGAARDLEYIANSFESGRVHLSNPMSSSRLYDIPVAVGQLRAMHDSLLATANAVLGIERGTLLKATIATGFEPTYTLEGEPVTLEQFFTDNHGMLTTAERLEVRNLRPGEHYLLGGGAEAEMVFERVS